MPDFILLPELPIEKEVSRWNLFFALKDGLQKVIDTFTASDSAWTYAYLLNGWQNYGSPYQAAGYRLDGNNMVHLSGVLKDGTIETIFLELPINMRPAYTLRFPVASDADSVGSITINRHGQVTAEAACSVTLLSLDGITFRVE